MLRSLAPRIRARAFAREGTYRFSVVAAHPCLGLLFAYAGRLEGFAPYGPSSVAWVTPEKVKTHNFELSRTKA
ncbi:DUF4166 domain-containing protein [Phenylobacterium sp.]|uniref:DUF4166 domain-containing protein n=1 Tax=Phenylobacterium sp. TaxID=1871053 RepID=UPI002F93E226